MADNRGGVRQGSIGGQYPNRRDLRTPGQHITPSNLPPSRQYGQGVSQAQSLSVTPTGAPSPAASPSQPAPNYGPMTPGSIPGLSDPTANPDEPVTAGLPIGPGVGPEQLNVMTQDSPELAILHSLYLEYPNADIRRFMAYLEDTLRM